MYYFLMKTLVRPQTNSTIASSSIPLYRTKRIETLDNHRNKNNYLKFVFLCLTSVTFLFVQEKPELSEAICYKYNSEIACSSW